MHYCTIKSCVSIVVIELLRMAVTLGVSSLGRVATGLVPERAFSRLFAPCLTWRLHDHHCIRLENCNKVVIGATKLTCLTRSYISFVL